MKLTNKTTSVRVKEAKKCKCRKCGREFIMPDNFMGTITCEDCDPFLSEQKQQDWEQLDNKLEVLFNRAGEILVKYIQSKITKEERDTELSKLNKLGLRFIKKQLSLAHARGREEGYTEAIKKINSPSNAK